MADLQTGAIDLAEKVLTLLDQGRFTATYKYAVLLGLMDLCLEGTSRAGVPPSMVTTRQLAEKVVELYWPQTMPFGTDERGHILRQNQGAAGSQAAIVSAVARFRGRSGAAALSRVKVERQRDFARLIDTVEWKLIQMPLPRLQTVGGRPHRFLYDIAWTDDITNARVKAYQGGDSGDFDNRILLMPGVGDALVRLNGLLRPLIHRQWTAQVARLNSLPDSRLEAFLFGGGRKATEAVRPHLQELQSGRCFYCRRPLLHRAQVDHFIPWSRYPDNGLANLVVAHDHCNLAKRDFLAATDHVERWLARNGEVHGAAMEHIARDARWELRWAPVLGVAAGVYLGLPADAELWVRTDRFEPVDLPRLRRGFGVGPA